MAIKWIDLVYVGLGGCIGSVARYIISQWSLGLSVKPLFPYGTFIANVLGCLLIGYIGGLFEAKPHLNQAARLFLIIGVLGGFTTFSTFSYESLSLLRSGQFFIFTIHSFFHLFFCLLGAFLGFQLTRI